MASKAKRFHAQASMHNGDVKMGQLTDNTLADIKSAKSLINPRKDNVLT